MNTRRQSTLWLALSLLAFASVATAQGTPYELELGFRWTDVSGNEDMYRTQINEDDGLLIRSFTMLSTDFGGSTDLIDHFRLDVSELGTGPAGFLRLEAGKTEAWELKLRYRNADQFSALPAFANPLLGQGIIPGQHTIDRNRTTLDLDLEVQRWRNITPFLGYTWFTNDGPGTTTYSVGGDDFLLASDLDETETELRAGFGFRFANVYGQVTQGWRSLESDETLALFSGAGAGNNAGGILERPISAADITRTGETEVDAPFTNVYAAGQFGSRVRLIADYVDFGADTESFEDESASGAFASFAISRFFAGFDESVVSEAESSAWRAGLRAEVNLVPGVDLLAGWRQQNRELEGAAVITTLFTDATPFFSGDVENIEEILTANNSLERDETLFDLGVRARALGPFTVWATYTKNDQDLTVSPSAAEIVVPGAQGGEFERSIDTIDVGASTRIAGLALTASYRMDDADDAIVRTDFLERNRGRFRAAWTSTDRRFRVGGTFQTTERTNDGDTIEYDSEVEQLTADVEFAPIESLAVWAMVSDFQADSTILFRRPSTFQLDRSVHVEDGQAVEGGLRLFVRRFTADAMFGTFENDGTNPFEISRFTARLGWAFNDRYGLAGEWAHDEYEEAGLPLADFEADRFGIYLRLNR